MPTDSLYAAHCREVCPDYCGKGKPVVESGDKRYHWDRGQLRHVPCTAPTELEYAEQQARIAEIRRVKLEHAEEALRKRREQVQKGRLMLLNAARSLQSYDASYGGGGGDSEVCDEPGCDAIADCGWPSSDGYRHTCGNHSRWGRNA